MLNRTALPRSRGFFQSHVALAAACLAASGLIFSSLSLAAEPRGGICVIIGGNLRHSNTAIYQRLIEAAGGAKQCRIAVLTSASTGDRGARHVAEALADYGVSGERIAIVDIRPENAAQAAYDTVNVAQIRHSTAAYFVGGDQERIPRALCRPDGGDTPALAALRELFARGGVIAGSSAGAAMQSETMIEAAGLHDGAMDEGLDVLDFGLTSDPQRRGLFVTKGLGFFRAGVIDQHFHQSRGRLSRLARVTAEKKIRFGFGIDENTALVVGPNGAMETVGAGNVTIVDAAGAACVDGPLGCRLQGLRISCMQTGDHFDPRCGLLTPRPEKELVARDDEWKAGNHLITDISAPGAVPYAIFLGLGGNSSRRQVGVALHYTREFAHGYRFTFRKLESTRVLAGHIDNVMNWSVRDIALDIEPIVSALQPSASELPDDLPPGPAGTACRAVWYRGILLADRQRHFQPGAALTRLDLATALAEVIHLGPPEREVRLADVPDSSPSAEAVFAVVGAKLMGSDAAGFFHPAASVSRQEAAAALVRAWEFDRGRKLPAKEIPLADESEILPAYRGAVLFAAQAGWLLAENGRSRARQPITRGDAAVALYRLLGLPW